MASITDQEATHHSLLKASGPPNVLGAPFKPRRGLNCYFCHLQGLKTVQMVLKMDRRQP
jgi:hypothetical protein